MPVDRKVFEFYIETVKRLLPSANWCAAGIGKYQKIIKNGQLSLEVILELEWKTI